jgi:hypothetical protein
VRRALLDAEIDLQKKEDYFKEGARQIAELKEDKG